MSEITQTPDKHNEYEIGTQFVFDAEPTGLETARTAAVEGLSRVLGNIRMETRMLVFDALHGTQYRRIRHDLVEQKRRAEFERSIGLVATGRK